MRRHAPKEKGKKLSAKRLVELTKQFREQIRAPADAEEQETEMEKIMMQQMRKEKAAHAQRVRARELKAGLGI